MSSGRASPAADSRPRRPGSALPAPGSVPPIAPPTDTPRTDPFPEHLRPALAQRGPLPREDGGWAYEIKWDGIRALAYHRPGSLRFESRNLNDLTPQYPELRGLGQALGDRTAVLDGEIVAFDDRGLPSFERLQQRMHIGSAERVRLRAADVPVVYVIFDLLYLDGRSTMALPLRDRRALLDELGLSGPAWTTPGVHLSGGAELLAASAERGLEGIVAKRLDARYEPGRRTGGWVKVKNGDRQELVIGGWLPGQGQRRERIGALLVGYHDPDGDLRYAGRVGTGFGAAELERLAERLGPLEQPRSPFTGRQPPAGSVHVRPELVAEIEFAEWTRQGMLRQPSYKGLREDKPAREVTRESLGDAEVAAGSDGPAVPSPRGRRRPRAAAASPDPTAPAPAAPSGGAAPEYEVISETPTTAEVAVDGRRLRLSNRGKVLYPEAGFTKGEVIDYYAAIAPVLVPHTRGRPLTLKRYPDGVAGKFFYEKRCPAHRPDWVATAPIWSGRAGGEIAFCLANDRPSLMWAANMASIELHVSLALATEVTRPTAVVFDLDPGEPAGLVECARVALWLRDMFAALELDMVVKGSGSKGLQAYVPLNTPTSYAETKPFAQAVAQLVEKQHPELVVSRMSRQLRPGRVFIDWSQNDEHKTTVSVYSLRARPRPTVSAPLAWAEVERAHRRGDPAGLSFEAGEMEARIARHGDLFAPLLDMRQELPRLG
ncbi:MAG: bifunctional non-ous end joining protein LigD [Solirubrobacteraceae bacterium]|nr:bifunctional non-ous end joining protein LigD [Solirubrobacteraceae bacterium]